MATPSRSARCTLAWTCGSTTDVGRLLKPGVFIAGLVPLAWLLWAAFADALGANPAEALIRSLGDWALRGLVSVLAVTPLRVGLGWPWLARLRRMLGLYVFFYATLHGLAYAWLDMGLELPAVGRDVVQRPFILVGALAWLMLVTLAATSFDRAVRALGGRRWRALHRAVYAIAVLAMLHFWWMRAGKRDYAEVAVYAAVFAVLLGWRLWRYWRGRGTAS